VIKESIPFSSNGSYDPDGSIVEYSWDFGDGNTSNDANPSPTYSEPGTYTVTLTIIDNDNKTNTGTTIAVITLVPRIDPIAEPKGPDSGEEGSTISFSSEGSNDPDGSIIEYSWDFGDGHTSNDANPSHTYSEPGTYIVKLTVTDDQDNKDTSMMTCIINPEQNTAPISNIYGNYEVKIDKAITFSSEGSYDSDGSLVEYSWDFGDGHTSNDANPSHTYSEAGEYTVKLTVKDDKGVITTDMTICQVLAPTPINLLPVAVGGTALAAISAAVYFLKNKAPTIEKPRPITFRIFSESEELPADGYSKTTLNIDLLDKNGNQIKASEDIEVVLTSTLGSITSPIIINKGESQGQATLISSKENGAVSISAQSKGLMKASTSVAFLEKRRFCMICGASMDLDALVCSRCGRTPPSGVDVKKCKNCGNIIPTVADYCSDCGASQPK